MRRMFDQKEIELLRASVFHSAKSKESIVAKLSKNTIELPSSIKEDFIYIYGPRKFFENSSEVILYEDSEKFIIPNVSLKDVFAGDVFIHYVSDYSRNNVRSNLGSYQFKFSPFKWQKLAVNRILVSKYSKGLIKAPTGSGKSIFALYLAKNLNKSAIIVVDRKVLVNQWEEKIKEAFDNPVILKINSKNISQISLDSVYDFGIVTVQTLLSLMKENFDYYSEFFNNLNFDIVIYDEAHTTASADAFGKSVALFKNYSHIFGLTATPYKNSPVVKYAIGKIIIEANDFGYENRLEETLEIKVNKTKLSNFKVKTWRNIKMHNLFSNYLSAYESNEELRQRLTNLIVSSSRYMRGKMLVVLGRLETVSYLENTLSKLGIKVSILTSQKKDNLSETNIIIGTYGTVSKGFDCPELSTLITTVPVHGKISVVQLLGRLVRKVQGKHKVQAIFLVDEQFEKLFGIREFESLVKLKYHSYR